MGKEVRGKAEAAALSADPERSIGAYLARQRELRGISLDELAVLTRIPRRSLARLESGVFDRAPDGFVRGFVRTVAAALGLDPDETVMRLLSEPAAEALDVRGAPVRWTSPAMRLALVAVVGLLAAAALGWFAATGFTPRPAAAPEPEDVLVRPDPIRELARDAAARPPPAAPEAPAAEPAPAAAEVPVTEPGAPAPEVLTTEPARPAPEVPATEPAAPAPDPIEAALPGDPAETPGETAPSQDAAGRLVEPPATPVPGEAPAVPPPAAPDPGSAP